MDGELELAPAKTIQEPDEIDCGEEFEVTLNKEAKARSVCVDMASIVDATTTTQTDLTFILLSLSCSSYTLIFS